MLTGAPILLASRISVEVESAEWWWTPLTGMIAVTLTSTSRAAGFVFVWRQKFVTSRVPGPLLSSLGVVAYTRAGGVSDPLGTVAGTTRRLFAISCAFDL